jgi:DNA-binding transcriptional ArsR family regulator
MKPAPAASRVDTATRDMATFDLVARALGDGTRRGILRLVRDDELPAGDLARQFAGISRPAVSQHLRVLHDAGLVSMRRDGNRRMYRARTEGLAEVWQFIDDMWSDRLARLKRALEADAEAEAAKERSEQ